jgi:hypothetical protein
MLVMPDAEYIIVVAGKYTARYCGEIIPKNAKPLSIPVVIKFISISRHPKTK